MISRPLFTALNDINNNTTILTLHLRHLHRGHFNERESSAALSRLRKVMASSTARRAIPSSSLHAITATPSSMDNRCAFPADTYLSTASDAGMKRKEQDFEEAASTMKKRDLGDETKVDVFVRCRGRNEQEVRESSTVAVKTDGVKGKTVELSLGANTLSNKTYSFDKVFSPIADQQMIFDEVVEPVLDEVRLSRHRCVEVEIV
jgi:kinesin family protein 11